MKCLQNCQDECFNHSQRRRDNELFICVVNLHVEGLSLVNEVNDETALYMQVTLKQSVTYLLIRLTPFDLVDLPHNPGFRFVCGLIKFMSKFQKYHSTKVNFGIFHPF